MTPKELLKFKKALENEQDAVSAGSTPGTAEYRD